MKFRYLKCSDSNSPIYAENSSIVVFDMRLFSYVYTLCLPVLQVHQRTLSLETERARDNFEGASPLPGYG